MSSTSPKQRRRWRTWLGALLVLVVSLLIAGELVARFYLGLGDPPLSMADPEIEYLFKPSQDVSRFGNQIKYNAYSMRSDAFPKVKPESEVLRVLVLGDSIVNGGSQTDQSELATELLKAGLTQQCDGDVQVGNIFAGSWGPGNLLAYIKRYGLFDADAIVLVISSHDAADVPIFKPIVGVSPAFPDQKPTLALEEFVFRYLPRYLPGAGTSGQDKPEQMPAEEASEDFVAIEDLDALFKLITDSQTPFILLQHPNKQELANGYEPGYQAIADAADRMGVVRMDMAPYLQAVIDQSKPVYRDRIHLNAAGQQALAQALRVALSTITELE